MAAGDDAQAAAGRAAAVGGQPRAGGDLVGVRRSRKAVTGGEPEIRLHLQAHTALQMSCQRCLQPLTVLLDVQPSLRFVRGEQQAEALDEDSDEDVLALTPSLDLLPLTEDELILALPLVPRHEDCPQPLPMSAGEDEIASADDAEHAFAGLASLLRDSGAASPAELPSSPAAVL